MWLDEQYIAQRNVPMPIKSGLLKLVWIDRKSKLRVDGRFWMSIIRPTSGAVETENSLVNKQLCKIRQRVASVHRSPEEVDSVVLFGAINVSIFSVESGGKEVLTAACNAVEFASR
ncbi:hypothetical protein QF005_001174 [Pseudomonas sp. PvP006]|uniref:hypothetical protein n=1 Tax=Pseudomonas trivialis TaxID=200450 RepID=UPI00277E0357|nr:hypothetical protein [Pseudomonas sp. PvP006]